MINQFNAEKSCLDKLFAYADSNSYSVAVSDSEFAPKVDEIFLEESYLVNENEQGLSNSSSQMQPSIYQIKINTPKIMGKSKGLEIVDELMTFFARGSNISNTTTQQVRIEQVNNIRLPATSTHNVRVVSVNLMVIG